jgi:hypothetical protein
LESLSSTTAGLVVRAGALTTELVAQVTAQGTPP